MQTDWRQRAAAALSDRFAGDTSFCLDLILDSDGDYEVFITLRGAPGHGRIYFGGRWPGRYAFMSYGWQGCGGGQLDIPTNVGGVCSAARFHAEMLIADKRRLDSEEVGGGS